MATTSCKVCRDLSPPPVPAGKTIVLFTTIKRVYEQACRGCRHCSLLQSSFVAATTSQEAQELVNDSGKWSSVDFRLFFDYLEDGTKSIKLAFQSNAVRLDMELFGVVGQQNARNFTTKWQSKPSQGSSSSTNVVERWLEDCTSSHKSCGNGTPTVLPKRILDIGRESRRVFLIETCPTTIARYACQSYCWGTSHTVTTTSATYEQHRAGTDVASLPRTFQDTIAFARSLDLDYLWIDSMCIIQDSIDDWRQEAAKMAQYYSNAYVTLSATMSTNSAGGLFQESPDATLSMHDQTWIVSRGWIFQERLLSPRVIHFGSTEMYFECNTLSTFTWHRIVEAYCKLRITVPSDKLPALAGLADQMRNRRHGAKYLAGLWEDSMLVDLLWSCRPNREGLAPKLESWRAPSWSWASVAGPVRYGGYPRLDVTFSKVLDAQCDYAPLSTTGEVISGYLLIEGPTIEGSVRDSQTLCSRPDGTASMNGHFFADYQLDGGVISVTILRIGRDPHGLKSEYLLVLKPTKRSLEYDRLGLFESFVSGSPWAIYDWTDARKTTLRIV
ncbi:HET-domain-containing protein [Polyplosphaeria fusca]|uniref:HET-domain-containing protein n=1 Tax=Polyplosphaeria fusca TaxID=682080 RepID=A0A9P4UW13_9PLEO|nr:HET-domain-containing protein [Polyplosphaeria fusca]